MRHAARILIGMSMIGLFSLSLIWGVPEVRAAEDQQVIVKIDGLSCPFCAYGVEKKLKALEGVKDIHVKMNEGEVIVTFAPETKVDPEAIKQAVEDSGFTAREIIVPTS